MLHFINDKEPDCRDCKHMNKDRLFRESVFCDKEKDIFARKSAKICKHFPKSFSVEDAAKSDVVLMKYSDGRKCIFFQDDGIVIFKNTISFRHSITDLAIRHDYKIIGAADTQEEGLRWVLDE